jgi:hypothetical protein
MVVVPGVVTVVLVAGVATVVDVVDVTGFAAEVLVVAVDWQPVASAAASATPRMASGVWILFMRVFLQVKRVVWRSSSAANRVPRATPRGAARAAASRRFPRPLFLLR